MIQIEILEFKSFKQLFDSCLTAVPTKMKPIKLKCSTNLNLITLIEIVEYTFLNNYLTAVIRCFTSCYGQDSQVSSDCEGKL